MNKFLGIAVTALGLLTAGNIITTLTAVRAVATLESIEPFVGPGYPATFEVECAFGSPTLLRAGDGMVSYQCQNLSTHEVYVGGDDVTPGTGVEFCATNCESTLWDGNMRYEYCVADVDAGVEVQCRAMVPHP